MILDNTKYRLNDENFVICGYMNYSFKGYLFHVFKCDMHHEP